MKKKILPIVILLLCSIVALRSISEPVASKHASSEIPTAESKLVRSIVESEELISSLTPQIRLFADSVKNLELPCPSSKHVFDSTVDFADIQVLKPSEFGVTPGVLGKADGTCGKLQPVAVEPGVFWREVFRNVSTFENAKFYFIDGSFSQPDNDMFESTIGFSGLAQSTGKTWLSVTAKQKVNWRRLSDKGDVCSCSNWKIASWKTIEAEVVESEKILFEEKSEDAFPDPRSRALAETSGHHDELVAVITTGRSTEPNERRSLEITANANHPGLSIVDIDQDGWDDMYVSVRRGRNLLFRNNQDGTFVECASKFGLDLGGVTNCSIFADFDNDGDKDVFLGRGLERSVLLQNDNGSFSPWPNLNFNLPYLVTSASAADFNNDGLLDLYLCTYGIPQANDRAIEKHATEFLKPSVAGELIRRIRDKDSGHNKVLNAFGPPNLLLVNGGASGFRQAKQNEQVQTWYNSFQSAWADFDRDGDVDLYVANDFAQDCFFRNDGGSFVEISDRTHGNSMRGFGMGISWGDYDNDGFQDLYVSNMYSKAGLRIVSQVSELDERFLLSANGNRLYRNLNDDGAFELTSGTKKESQQVAKAGWSWGGQFADFDNDGDLDIYVTSGYRTAPDEIAFDDDL